MNPVSMRPCKTIAGLNGTFHGPGRGYSFCALFSGCSLNTSFSDPRTTRCIVTILVHNNMFNTDKGR